MPYHSNNEKDRHLTIQVLRVRRDTYGMVCGAHVLRRKGIGSRTRCAGGNNRGSVMPFVVMSMFLLFVTVGISTDFMRDFETASQLGFAAQAAALYGLSLATNPDGSYSYTSAQSNISNAILNAPSWNIAQFGPQNQKWSKPVSFSATDIQYVTNPSDQKEFFLQLKASRQGSDSLVQFFLPLAYANFSSSVLPLSTVSPAKVIEVFGQPATRIGAGAPASSAAGSRDGDFVGFATLPLAISNNQFAAATASPAGTIFTIDMVSSTTKTSTQPGHIKGCFVNVAGSGSSGNYYSSATGSQGIAQLIAMLNYFASGNSSVIPTNVESGSVLGAFDPNAMTGAQQTSISQVFSLLPSRYYIIPVLAGDPSFAGNNNTVVGFARMRLDTVNTINGAITSLVMDIGESIPLRNASSATGFSSVSNNSNSPMPAPVFPFLPRQYDYASNGINPRLTGIILAPALSPRMIKPS